MDRSEPKQAPVPYSLSGTGAIPVDQLAQFVEMFIGFSSTLISRQGEIISLTAVKNKISTFSLESTIHRTNLIFHFQNRFRNRYDQMLHIPFAVKTLYKIDSMLH